MKIRKKPITVDGVQFTENNKSQAFDFITCKKEYTTDESGKVAIKIKTLEGWVIASLNDWIIKGVAGEFYPCKPDIFEKTYDIINEEVQ